MPQGECGFPSQPDSLVQFGPTLQVRIGFDPAYRDGHTPNLANTEYHALVDTGASESCIDSSIATTVDLPIIDRQKVSGAHGSAEVNIHLAQIFIPVLGVVLSGKFAGVHLHAGGQPHSALMGRTLLRHVTMAYNGITGSVTIAYSRPSGAGIP